LLSPHYAKREEPGGLLKKGACADCLPCTSPRSPFSNKLPTKPQRTIVHRLQLFTAFVNVSFIADDFSKNGATPAPRRADSRVTS